MSTPLRFDQQVALITGAGNGIGRAHAHLLASRGVRVVINDVGRQQDGSSSAEQVVAEIRAAGGEAVANRDSVEQGEKLVQQALDQFGRLDIVINNAGVIRDSSYHKMDSEQWQLVQAINLNGAHAVTRAAWPHLREQNYGRVLFTVSAASIYGNFGQANYSSAKLALYGLTRTLAVEGLRNGIHVNAIAPIAASAMMGERLSDEWQAKLRPECISPLAAWLCHRDCQENGALFEAAGGWFAKVRWERSAGTQLNDPNSVDELAERWNEVIDFSNSSHPDSVQQSSGEVLHKLGLL